MVVIASRIVRALESIILNKKLIILYVYSINSPENDGRFIYFTFGQN